MDFASLPIQNGWIEHDRGAMGGAWFWPRGTPAPDTAVLLVPGIAHEERTMNGGIVALGHALAHAGLASLLIDLSGTLQSSGELDDAEIGERWRADIRRGVAHLREAGFSNILVAGVRVGSLLAFDALADEQLLGIVAWVPILSGRRYVRELKVLQGTARVELAPGADQICVAGFDLSRPLLDHLAALDTTKLKRLPTRRVLVVDTESTPLANWISQAEAEGVTVQRIEPLETDAWLARTEALPVLPFADLRAIADWCASQRPVPASASAARPGAIATRIAFTHHGERIRESIVDIAPGGLSAVLCEPEGRAARGMTLLLLSTVGPGRSFTNFARDEAASGRASLRFDLAGFGSSQRRNSPLGGEVYTLPGRADVVDAVAHLRRCGHHEIAMLGFCSQAWAMVHAGPLPGVRAAMALNVALYVEPGRADDHNPAIPTRAPKWISDLIGERLLKRVERKLRRVANRKTQPVGWLEQFGKSGVHVLLAFSDHDPGQTYLNRQLGRVLRGQIQRGLLEMRAYAGLGHLLESPVARARAFADLHEFMQRIDRQPAATSQAGLPANANASSDEVATQASTSSSSR